MRTTLDIDDNMLAIARARARERGISLGAAVSDIMRQGLRVPSQPGQSGFPIFSPPRGAHPVTDELVAQYRDEDSTSL